VCRSTRASRPACLDRLVWRVQACKICVDAKTDYPAACNAVEKVLVHRAHERNGNIFKLHAALREAHVTVRAPCSHSSFFLALIAERGLARARCDYGMQVASDVIVRVACASCANGRGGAALRTKPCGPCAQHRCALRLCTPHRPTQ
jgi:hypothetical protein